MNGWLLVLLAGALEIVWAAALKASDGFQRPVPAVLGVACAALSLFLLSLALRSIPVSVAYAIWVAIGTAGVAIYGMAVLHEPISLVKIASLVLVGIGAVGLVAGDA